MIWQSERRDRRNHHRPFAGPLWNLLPVLMMAAGRIHLRMTNGHPWAEEAATPKLADSHRGGSEELVESLTMKTFEKMFPGDWTPQNLIEASRGQPRTMTKMTQERTFPGGSRIQRQLRQRRLGRAYFHLQPPRGKP